MPTKISKIPECGFADMFLLRCLEYLDNYVTLFPDCPHDVLLSFVRITNHARLPNPEMHRTGNVASFVSQTS